MNEIVRLSPENWVMGPRRRLKVRKCQIVGKSENDQATDLYNRDHGGEFRSLRETEAHTSAFSIDEANYKLAPQDATNPDIQEPCP
jgi:hypothetical protein